MKITKWDDDRIYFSDGSTISYHHVQDCCESNWADFSVLEIHYRQEEFVNFDIIPVEDLGFILSLESEQIPFSPISFLGEWGHYYTPNKKILIPCYSDQNGYYSTNLIIDVDRPDETNLEYPLNCRMRAF